MVAGALQILTKGGFEDEIAKKGSEEDDGISENGNYNMTIQEQ